ncbi:hypothetical protein BV25DRAFT_1833163 [Artomyces pyxidatus]|uniref:Uncharacterized protein n=1 Tax=Artomyces pyxidatus TaxID=48021 RepID=A0ACB8SFX0_9AGAM|nr:hypothetical protein BV25DRAFT_1833163 [Artomyces pyxidatus]
MSNEASRADQIAYKYYAKLANIVYQARATAQTTNSKQDKWFNFETPDTDAFRDQLRIYKTVSSTAHVPVLRLDVLLRVPELAPTHVLVVARPPDAPRLPIDPAPRFVLLESWALVFRPHTAEPDLSGATVYKHMIAAIRSLYTLLRVLPSWGLHRRLRRRNAPLSIEVRAAPVDNVLAFDMPAALNAPPLPHASHVFPILPHLLGSFALSVQYLTHPHFQLDERESLLSSRFISLDEGADFTPTLAKNQQRDSLSSSPGSLPLRTSLPASPPSVADRMVRPHSRTTSLPGSSPGARTIPLQMSKNADLGTMSGLSSTSSRLAGASRDDGHPVIPTLGSSRLRKESTGSVRGPDLPSSPGPLSIRRPQLNPLNPFKSSTLSSSPSLHSPSPSLRQVSPLSAALPARPSPPSSRVPPSPIGRLSSPVTSSLGHSNDGGSLVGGEGRSGPKRYSSSFGHRYKDSTGGASDVSAGSADRKEGDKGGSPSYLSANADEEDLSAFMNDTNQPKPLNRRYRSQNADPNRDLIGSDRAPAETSASSSPRIPFAREISDSGTENALGLGVGPMLTSEAAIDDQLRRMNETFSATLEFLGSGRRRERTQSSPGRDLRTDRISEVTEPSTTGSGTSVGVSRNTSLRSDAGRDVRLPELLLRPRPGSRTDSITSEEVLGKLELDDERRRSMGR